MGSGASSEVAAMCEKAMPDDIKTFVEDLSSETRDKLKVALSREPGERGTAPTGELTIRSDCANSCAVSSRATSLMEDRIGDTAIIVIKTLSGDEVLRFDRIPSTVAELKALIAESGYMPVALQKLLRDDGLAVCEDGEALEAVDQAMLLIKDETPMWYWDVEGNPQKTSLCIVDNVIKCPNLRDDYCNVLTREPICIGLHYFEFHMHYYGDEQWCGLTPDPNFVGSAYEVAVPSKKGYMYYTGRNKGALEAVGHHLKVFKFVDRSNSSIIGMLVDCNNGAVAFDLNGTIQGACEIPKNTRLWILTHVDTPRDHIELRKPSLQDAPPTNFDALKGALLDVSHGVAITRSY